MIIAKLSWQIFVGIFDATDVWELKVLIYVRLSQSEASGPSQFEKEKHKEWQFEGKRDGWKKLWEEKVEVFKEHRTYYTIGA